MTLHEFHPKLLNFLYELTKLDGLKSSTKIANEIRLENGEKVTPKTVRNWFTYLNQPYQYKNHYLERKLSYFPVISRPKMGLRSTYVIYEDPSPQVINMFPFQEYVAWLYDPKLSKNVLIAQYTLTEEKIKEFEKVLIKLKNMGLFANFSTHTNRTLVRTYSPLHKVLDKNGIFHHDKNDSNELDKQINEFKNRIFNVDTTEMSNAVKNNLFTIPVLNEYNYEHWTSRNVWFAIKEKLGDNVWNYIRKAKRKTDGVGINKVQNVLSNMKKNELLLFMNVVYMPMEIKNNFFIYSFIKFNNKDELIKYIKTMAMNSIFQNIYIKSKNRALIIALVNSESLQNLFNMDVGVKIEKLYFLNYQKSGELITTTKFNKFDYSMFFDPVNKRWNFDDYLKLPAL